MITKKKLIIFSLPVVVAVIAVVVYTLNKPKENSKSPSGSSSTTPNATPNATPDTSGIQPMIIPPNNPENPFILVLRTEPAAPPIRPLDPAVFKEIVTSTENATIATVATTTATITTVQATAQQDILLGTLGNAVDINIAAAATGTPVQIQAAANVKIAYDDVVTQNGIIAEAAKKAKLASIFSSYTTLKAYVSLQAGSLETIYVYYNPTSHSGIYFTSLSDYNTYTTIIDKDIKTVGLVINGVLGSALKTLGENPNSTSTDNGILGNMYALKLQYKELLDASNTAWKNLVNDKDLGGSAVMNTFDWTLYSKYGTIITEQLRLATQQIIAINSSDPLSGKNYQDITNFYDKLTVQLKSLNLDGYNGKNIDDNANTVELAEKDLLSDRTNLKRTVDGTLIQLIRQFLLFNTSILEFNKNTPSTDPSQINLPLWPLPSNLTTNLGYSVPVSPVGIIYKMIFKYLDAVNGKISVDTLVSTMKSVNTSIQTLATSLKGNSPQDLKDSGIPVSGDNSISDLLTKATGYLKSATDAQTGYANDLPKFQDKAKLSDIKNALNVMYVNLYLPIKDKFNLPNLITITNNYNRDFAYLNTPIDKVNTVNTVLYNINKIGDDIKNNIIGSDTPYDNNAAIYSNDIHYTVPFILQYQPPLWTDKSMYVYINGIETYNYVRFTGGPRITFINQAASLDLNIDMSKYANPEPVGTLKGNNAQLMDFLKRMNDPNWTAHAGQLRVIGYSYGDNNGKLSFDVPFTYYSPKTPKVESIPAGTLVDRIARPRATVSFVKKPDDKI